MDNECVPKQTLQRLPVYLNYLKTLSDDSYEYISATVIANALKLNDVQVRKDLACISKSGRPKIGYVTKTLIDEIEINLGYKESENAVMVGAGKLGKALISYHGFKEYGLNITLAFDNDPAIIGTEIEGIKIHSVSELSKLCREFNIKIAIITVPAKNAQQICDMLVDCGVLAVWNFAPTHLIVPDNILVQNENMAASLALLSNHLASRLKNEKTKL